MRYHWLLKGIFFTTLCTGCNDSMYKPDINNKDNRVDLFETHTTKPIIKTGPNELHYDTAFLKSTMVASTAETKLIDSTFTRLSSNAGFYLYTSWISRYFKNVIRLQKVYFITPGKLNITDSNAVILFLIPIKNHTILKKYGDIQWQWLPKAPILFNDSLLLNHWQSLHYFQYNPAPTIYKYKKRRKKIKTGKYELQLLPYY